MTPVPLSKTKIETKLAIMRDCLLELEKLSTLSENDFTADKRNFALAEHYLRRALEAVFDIGGHIISRFPYSPGKRPNTFKEIAKALGEKSIVDQKFARDILTKMAGYRNRLVHFYAELTPSEIYQIIKKKRGDIETFTAAVVKVLADPQKFSLTVDE